MVQLLTSAKVLVYKLANSVTISLETQISRAINQELKKHTALNEATALNKIQRKQK